MIQPICRMGNPVLRAEAREILFSEIKTDFFARLIRDLLDSMKHYGGIGIAAPQIGVSLKVALIELKEFNRYGEQVNLPLTAFINPKIQYLTQDTQGFWEGCLSVPGLRGLVERPKKVKVNFLNELGEEREIIAEGFLATVLQHELDHLEGTLYIDRIKDPRLLSFQEEYDAFIQGQNSIE
jgi:peptide deformylase